MLRTVFQIEQFETIALRQRSVSVVCGFGRKVDGDWNEIIVVHLSRVTERQWILVEFNLRRSIWSAGIPSP